MAVFEDKRLADEAVAAVEKVIQHENYDGHIDQKHATAETKENAV